MTGVQTCALPIYIEFAIGNIENCVAQYGYRPDEVDIMHKGRFNDQDFNLLLPFLLRQEYINGVTKWHPGDAEPDVDIDNEDGFEIFDNGWELETLDDGCESNWEFPSEMTESDRRSMLEGWDNDQFCYMEENGWEMDYSEIYFYGQLELEGN